MPRASDGSYSLPPGTIVSSGDVIQPSQHNPAMQDIAQALGNSLDRDGSGAMRAPLKMGGFPIENVGQGSAPNDVATVAQIGLSVPVGSILDFAGTIAPDTFLFAYGQAISRTDYTELFAAIGTTYGSGNGSTTFNLPDCRGRVSAGKDDMGGISANRLTSPLNGDTLGAAGGAEGHALSVGELPAHNHGGSTGAAGDHAHYTVGAGTSGTTLGSGVISQNGSAGGDSEYALKQSPNYPTMGITGTDGAHTHSIPSQGSGDAHNNVQPTIILNKIIKARSA